MSYVELSSEEISSLSKRKRLEKAAEELLFFILTKTRYQDVKEYLDSLLEKYQLSNNCKLEIILRCFGQSFQTDKPLQNAQKVYWEIMPVYPRALKVLQKSLLGFVANAILGIGGTFSECRFKIEKNEDYYKFKQFILKELMLVPPRKCNVLLYLLTQKPLKQCLRKDPLLYHRMVDIFREDPHCQPYLPQLHELWIDLQKEMKTEAQVEGKSGKKHEDLVEGTSYNANN